MKGKRSRESSFIKHSIRLSVTGFKPERLISSAMQKRIAVRQVEYRDETEVRFTVSGDDFPEMRKLAGSRYVVRKIREGGAVRAADKLRHSRMAAAGLALFLLVFFAQTLFVREISVIGCRSISETALRASLAQAGLYEGALKRYDCNEIEKMLFQTYDNIVWTRVAEEGNYVEVQISESRQAPAAEQDRSEPCHIVADRDCYIERIYAYKGRAKAGEGDFVQKGGILISGRVPVEHPSYPVKEGKKLYHYTHAEGKVTARVPYYFSFFMKPQSDQITEKRQAQRLLREWIRENVPEKAEILNKDFHFDVKKNIIKVYGTIETRQQVGTEKEIVIDKHKRGIQEDSGGG